MANRLITIFPRVLLGIFIASFFASYLFFQNNSNRQVLGESLKIDPANTKVRLQFARELLAQGKEAEARENLKTLLLFDPKNTYASDMLSDNLSNSKEIKMDLEATIEVTNKRPDYKAAWERLSNLYEILGDFENARVARERAADIRY